MAVERIGIPLREALEKYSDAELWAEYPELDGRGLGAPIFFAGAGSFAVSCSGHRRTRVRFDRAIFSNSLIN